MSDANVWTSSKELGMGDSLRIIIHLEIFYLSNVGVSVNPQLLVPSSFLLAKLPLNCPAPPLKLSCHHLFVRDRFIRSDDFLHSARSTDWRVLTWIFCLDWIPWLFNRHRASKKPEAEAPSSIGCPVQGPSIYFKTIKSPGYFLNINDITDLKKKTVSIIVKVSYLMINIRIRLRQFAMSFLTCRSIGCLDYVSVGII